MNHHSSVESALDDIRTGEVLLLRDEPVGNLFTGWAVSGIEMARARSRHFQGTAGTRSCDAKGRSQVKQSEAASAEARHEGGPTRSSADGSVMDAERRGRVVSVEAYVISWGG